MKIKTITYLAALSGLMVALAACTSTGIGGEGECQFAAGRTGGVGGFPQPLAITQA